MRLARMLSDGEPRFFVQQADRLRDALRSTAADDAPPAPPAPLLSPVASPSKIICIGLNYAEHVGETGAETPAVPVVFAKWPNALTAPDGDVVLAPAATGALDYEGELAVVIGTRCRDVAAQDALACVGAYAVANDLSARDRQMSEGGQWTHSKSYDNFLPLGPWLTTPDAIADPQDLELTTTVNGEVRQHSSTAAMVFPVAELIAYLSTGLTLEPGDVILTGTPSGVAMALPGQPWLVAGDVVTVAIAGLGELSSTIVLER